MATAVDLIEVTDRSEADTDMDIIAIHGFDTTSQHTWTWKNPRNPRKNCTWLRPGMLPEDVARVRIFMCDWPANLLVPSDLVQNPIEEYALLLLNGIKNVLFAQTARQPDRSIVSLPRASVASS